MEELLTGDKQEDEKPIKQTSSLLTSNDDLRELCILLDEERQKMHELAEQWKEFSTSAINKLTCQIVDYQEKLNELEQRQIALLYENHSLKSLIKTNLPLKVKQTQQSVSTQTSVEKRESLHQLCFHRSKSIYDHLLRTKVTTEPNLSIRTSTHQKALDDPLQEQISIQNMFDAIKTAEVYESIEDMNGNNHDPEKKLLKEFCNFVWKYLEDRSKPKSSCLL